MQAVLFDKGLSHYSSEGGASSSRAGHTKVVTQPNPEACELLLVPFYLIFNNMTHAIAQRNTWKMQGKGDASKWHTCAQEE